MKVIPKKEQMVPFSPLSDLTRFVDGMRVERTQLETALEEMVVLHMSDHRAQGICS